MSVSIRMEKKPSRARRKASGRGGHACDCDDAPMSRVNGQSEDETVGTEKSLGNGSRDTPLVVALETADIRELDHLPELGWLDGAKRRRVHLQ